MTKIITIIVVAVGLTGLIAWDLVVNFNKIAGDTISEVAGEAFKSAPILAVIIGIIAGHLCSTYAGFTPVAQWLGARAIIPLLYGVLGGFLFWNMGR